MAKKKGEIRELWMCFFALAMDRGFVTGLNKAEQRLGSKSAVALGLGRNFVSLSFIHDFHLTFLF